MTQGSWRTSPLPANWSTIREAVLRRDGYRCTWMGDTSWSDGTSSQCAETGHGPGGRLEVDHVGRADDHSLDNLRTLCRFHHSRRTAAQAAAARGPRETKRRAPERHPGLLP